jgi:hypothetical protein
MCDYSLEMYRSRPAAMGEQYVLHRFRSGTLGFVDPADCTTAVCLPAGASLRLQAISRRLQRTLCLGPAPEAVMFRLPFGPGVHRDGPAATSSCCKASIPVCRPSSYRATSKRSST